MRKIGLRILGALAGALPFVLTAGQAAKAQTCTTVPEPTPTPTPTPAPAPAQPPSPDVAEKVATIQRDYCNAIARAGTPQEVQQVADKLAYNLYMASLLVPKQSEASAKIATAQARVNQDEQILAQKSAASSLGEIDSMIQSDQQAMADARAKAAAVEATGVNGGPSLSAIDQHIRENTALANKGVNPTERRQAQNELAQWRAKRNELMAAKADYAAAYAYAARDISQQQARRSAAQAAFAQTNPQFMQQVAKHRGELQHAQQYASSVNEAIQQNAPFLQGAQSLTNSVLQCGRQRLAQIGGGTTPPPYAPQASPAPSPQTAPPPLTP